MKKIILSVLLLGTVLSANATDVTCSEYDYLLPNPDDCNAFYVCANRQPILMHCPDGLYFHDEGQICDQPYNVDCKATPTTPKPSSTTPEPTTTTPEPTSTSTTPEPTTTTPEPTSTSTTPEPTTTTPEPTSTSTTSKPTTMTPRPTKPTTTKRPTTLRPTTTKRPTTLRPTTTKRPTTQRPTTTKRPTTQRPTTTKRPTTQRPTTTKKPTTIRPTTTKRPTTIRPTTTKRPTTPKPTTTTTEQPTTEKPVVCPRDSVVFLPIPHNCQQYILCYIVGNMTLTCPAGTEFDPVRLICNLPLFAQCDHGTKTLDPNTRTVEETTSSEDDETTVTQLQVPSTTSNYEPDCPETGYAVIVNPDNCSSFYVCVNGIYGFVNCPTGMDFNPETNRCDLPASKHCRRSTKEAATTPYISYCPENGTAEPRDCSCSCNCGGGAPPTSTAKPTTTTSKPTTSTTSEPTTARPSSSTPHPAFCSEGELEANPKDCSSYFQCVIGRLVQVKCPSGLEYDAVMKWCDHPEDANCQV